MNIYPAMKASIGRWDYFIVKMTMSELNDNVKFAADIYDDKTLDQAIQRVLNESRVKKDLVTYLIRQQDRFFSSIVVAAIGGEPKWYPVGLEDDPRFTMLRGDARMSEAFGILSFDGRQDYYALDGQHRLAAIKALIDKDSDLAIDAPEGFKGEEMSVLVVVPQEAESDEEFLKRYRRLFGNLNRYAKPMDQVTNIIMDEDDAFAIVTRRLITDHSFFKWSGRHRDSARVKMKKGKNLTKNDSYFTSLEALYDLNIRLLLSNNRKNSGWDAQSQPLADFSRFRPTDEVLDALFEELKMYWDGIIGEMPILTEEPSHMRDHSANEDSDTEDCLAFWPIGQEIMIEVARKLLDLKQPDPDNPTSESIKNALKGLNDLNWDFLSPPWRNLLLIPNADQSDWRIRSEDRKDAQRLASEIARVQVGIDPYDADELDDLRARWELMLLPALSDDEKDDLWVQIVDGIVG